MEQEAPSRTPSARARMFCPVSLVFLLVNIFLAFFLFSLGALARLPVGLVSLEGVAPVPHILGQRELNLLFCCLMNLTVDLFVRSPSGHLCSVRCQISDTPTQTHRKQPLICHKQTADRATAGSSFSTYVQANKRINRASTHVS